MEAFNLLRYWRTNTGDGTSNATVSTSTATTTTIVTGVNSPASETEDEVDDENDHGPFFDLEFSLPNDETENDSECREEDDEEEEEEEDSDGSDELKFTVLSGSTSDVNVSVSPSDELFFNDGFVPVDQTPEINSKPPEFRLSLMKSATKFRVMMLKFRKSKSNDESIESTDSKEEQKPDSSGKSMTVKLKRHNSSKASKKQQINDNEPVSGSSDEKKSPTETMQRYFRKVKPLYIRVSKKYGEKLKFTGQQTFPGVTKPNSTPSPSPSPTTEEQKQSPAAVLEPPLLPINANRLKQGNLPAGIRVVCKRFGKTWSASTPVTVSSAAAAPPVIASSNRRDDSLLQQQDGIQSAILHCKRSFKAARDSDCSSSLSSAPAPENMYSEVTKKINER